MCVTVGEEQRLLSIRLRNVIVVLDFVRTNTNVWPHVPPCV